MRNATDVLGAGSGVDLRRDGGYSIVAPSSIKRETWASYRWFNYPARVSEAPEWAWALVERRRQPTQRRVDLKRAIEQGIPEGTRDTDLFRIACLCRREGVSEAAAVQLIQSMIVRCRIACLRSWHVGGLLAGN